MNAVMLTNDRPNQWALANKLAKVVCLKTVVVSRNIPRKPPRRRLRLLANRIEGRLVGRPFLSAWSSMLERYRQSALGRPSAELGELVRVENVNDERALAAIAGHAPDLVIVSGTNLVGKRIIEEARRHGAIVNLHTGIRWEIA